MTPEEAASRRRAEIFRETYRRQPAKQASEPAPPKITGTGLDVNKLAEVMTFGEDLERIASEVGRDVMVKVMSEVFARRPDLYREYSERQRANRIDVGATADPGGVESRRAAIIREFTQK